MNHEATEVNKDKSFKEFIKPNSLDINKNAFIEPSLKEARVGARFKFQLLTYFNIDEESTTNNLIINRIVLLRYSWAKKEGKK